MPSFPPPRCDQRTVHHSQDQPQPQRGLDQFIEPLDPKTLTAESDAQEAFDALLLSKLSEKRNQLDVIRKNRRRELAVLRKKRPIPTKSVIFDPTTYTTMQQLKEVFSGSSRYIVKEVNRKVPLAKYTTKKKWFLGIRLIPLTDQDREEYENMAKLRRRSSSSSGKNGGSDTSDESGTSSEEEENEENFEGDSDDASDKESKKAKMSRNSIKKEKSTSSPRKRQRGTSQPASVKKSPSPTESPDSSDSSAAPASPASRPLPPPDVDTPTIPQLLARVSSTTNGDVTSQQQQPSAEAAPPSPEDEGKPKRQKRNKAAKFLLPMGPMGELATKGKLRTPTRRVGLAGKLQADYGSPIVAPNMTVPMALAAAAASTASTLAAAAAASLLSPASPEAVPPEEINDMVVDTSTEKAHGARVRIKPRVVSPPTPPMEESAGCNDDDDDDDDVGNSIVKKDTLLCSADGETIRNIKKSGSLLSTTKVEATLDETSSPPKFDPSNGKKDRLKSRQSIEDKLTSRRSNGVGAAVLRIVTPSKKKPKPKKKREKDEMNGIPKLKPDLIFQSGSTVNLVQIRDTFYPGRNTQMITKSVGLRVPGSFYNRVTKKFVNVAIVEKKVPTA